MATTLKIPHESRITCVRIEAADGCRYEALFCPSSFGPSYWLLAPLQPGEESSRHYTLDLALDAARLHIAMRKGKKP
jgi:hypothetical protein